MELKPGRELDARVAEAIGLQIYDHAWPQGYEPECGTLEAALSKEKADIFPWHSRIGPVYNKYPKDGGEVLPHPVPNFSTSLSATMGEPWEWLKSRFKNISLRAVERIDQGYWVEWWRDENTPATTETQPTEALAICAAVLAVHDELNALEAIERGG